MYWSLASSLASWVGRSKGIPGKISPDVSQDLLTEPSLSLSIHSPEPEVSWE